MSPTLSNHSLLILGNDAGLYDWFVEDTMATDDGAGGFRFTLDGHTLRFSSVSDASEVEAGSEVDACFCLIRFVDQAGMQALAGQLNTLADRIEAPVYFLIYRNVNEQDFKMSCPFCGQKLWVRDADLDKRGRCPSCKKGFTLPRQEDQVIQLLNLRQDAPVQRLTHGDGSTLAAAVRVFLKRKGDRDALLTAKQVFREKADTMVVRVD